MHTQKHRSHALIGNCFQQVLANAVSHSVGTNSADENHDFESTFRHFCCQIPPLWVSMKSVIVEEWESILVLV